MACELAGCLGRFPQLGSSALRNAAAAEILNNFEARPFSETRIVRNHGLDKVEAWLAGEHATLSLAHLERAVIQDVVRSWTQGRPLPRGSDHWAPVRR